jgi:hypothetical protein
MSGTRPTIGHAVSERTTRKGELLRDASACGVRRLRHGSDDVRLSARASRRRSVRWRWNTDWVTFDTVLLTVSTVAACAAAWFGGRAARDGQRLYRQARRDRQLDHLLAITRTLTEISDVSSKMRHLRSEGRVSHGADSAFNAAVDRLNAEMALVPQLEIPHCRALAGVTRDWNGANQAEGALVSQAIDEIANEIRVHSAAA